MAVRVPLQLLRRTGVPHGYPRVQGHEAERGRFYLKSCFQDHLTETYDYLEGYCRHSLTLGDNCVYYCVHDWRTLL